MTALQTRLILICLAGALVSFSARAASDAPPRGAISQSTTPPSGQVGRYLIPFFTSDTQFASGRTVTVVSVFNTSNVVCKAYVEFQYGALKSSACTITTSIAAKTSARLCSRLVSDPISPCNAVCPNGGLTFTTGHAYVGSGPCKIAVDPRVFYSSGDDTTLSGSARLSLVPINAGSAGD
ncbi:hypothetical protein [Methylocella sp.]|uniref:hypothetical protein n=1 Tax=Methylocella sp. TaxID=1978226 RepID=UPI0037853113